MAKKQFTVLVVEDSPVYRQIICKQLENLPGAQCETVFAGDLAQGVLELNSRMFDVILLDLTLPDSQGPETVERVLNARKDIPIIALTANEDEEVALETIRRGVQDYLIKGEFDAKLLLRVMVYSIERHRADRALQAMQDKLIASAKYESLARLADGIAHEVLNPLGIIRLGVSALFNHSQLSEDERQEIGLNIDEAIDRADMVIQGLREFSRPGDAQLQPEDPFPILQQVQLLLTRMCQEEGIRFEFNVYEKLPLILADRAAVEQALIQVAMNGINAMQDGGELTISAATAVQQSERKVLITVEDTGCGIKPEHFPQLFDPFFTTKKNWTDLGLGLSVVKGVLDRHKAQIEIANRESGGVCVTISFTALAESKAP